MLKKLEHYKEEKVAQDGANNIINSDHINRRKMLKMSVAKLF